MAEQYSRHKRTPRIRRLAFISIFVLVCIALAAVTRVPILRLLGHALVSDDPLQQVDVIVIGYDGGSVGELEAADLVHDRVASKVAVFAHVVSPEDREFLRRGVPLEDSAQRSIRQLMSLGVHNIEEIPIEAAGTESEARAIAAWAHVRGIRSVLVVTSSDHSRRFRRLLGRTMNNETRVVVRPARYSRFRPDEWWRTRDGIRTGIIELQKLLFDIARHPLS